MREFLSLSFDSRPDHTERQRDLHVLPEEIYSSFIHFHGHIVDRLFLIQHIDTASVAVRNPGIPCFVLRHSPKSIHRRISCGSIFQAPSESVRCQFIPEWIFAESSTAVRLAGKRIPCDRRIERISTCSERIPAATESISACSERIRAAAESLTACSERIRAAAESLTARSERILTSAEVLFSRPDCCRKSHRPLRTDPDFR